MKRVKFGISGHILENAWREWPDILHADVTWPPSELISLWRYWPPSELISFWRYFDLVKRVEFGVSGHFIGERMEGNGLKFCTLMYLDHRQKWLVYGHGLMIFLILAPFWLSERGQFWGIRAYPEQCMEGMAWNFACWCILTTFRTD